MTWRRSWSFVAAAVLAILLVKLVLFASHHSDHARGLARKPPSLWKSNPAAPPPEHVPSAPTTTLHPIAQLEDDGLRKFTALIESQSKTLEDAVREYRRRYGIPPPPLYDKWYDFARKRDLRLIDEFDSIHDALLPFWALEPASIRSRVREALGYEPNGLIALQVRNGKVSRLEGGPDWQITEMGNMIQDFVQFLPDMDLAFNLHDEPRIVVPHDELSEMVRIAKHKAMPLAFSNQNLQNSFSPRPADVDDGTRRLRIPKSSRFNEYQHQAVWVPSRLSCSPRSPARDFRDNVPDDTRGYALGDLGFVHNHTALSDICSSPSLRDNFGFFQRPNAFKVAHELIPIFSQSKISSFQDILYPSPWYHYGKTVTDRPAQTHQVQYNKSMDEEWEAKESTFWWRGSTTGGFSREGGWRRQHRQAFVSRINAVEDAKILVNQGSVTEPNWQTVSAPRQDYKAFIDIHFSSVGQCDPGDCDAQQEYFDMAEPVDTQQAWKYRFLLDIDGNAFSGRFHSFLRSNSLPFKLSIFREWHQDWIKPWVHYVPLSLRGEEHLEVVRYFAAEDDGMARASRLATQGKEWADQVLRNVDLEVWFFRLLLEYARVVDDSRDSIGFTI